MRMIICATLVAMCAGCASLDLDPREEQTINAHVATDSGTTATLSIVGPCPWFVENSATLTAVTTSYDGHTTDTSKATIVLGADAEEASNFYGKAISGLFGFLVGLFSNGAI